MLFPVFVLVFCLKSVFVNSECGIIKQLDWNVYRPQPTYIRYLPRPVDLVIYLHTSTAPCDTDESCQAVIEEIENKHVNEYHYWEIGYNFLIGGNGKVYEGPGFLHSGRHTHGYNSRSIGIGFIGNFNTNFPTAAALKAGQDLIKCGVKLGHIKQDYHLVGHNQLSKKSSPGANIVNVLKLYPHYLDAVSQIKSVSFHTYS